MEKHLHIISLTVPYPPDYGGVFDLFYKLPALKNEGIKIHLHCFDYGRKQQEELNKYCEEVFYYKRMTGSKGMSAKLPYIVKSRMNEELFNRLSNDNYPILMEGVHCTGLILDERFGGRKKFVRIHNVEQHYYHYLFQYAEHPMKKLYYLIESNFLKFYEKLLAEKANGFFTVTEKDAIFYKDFLGAEGVMYLPVFLPSLTVTALPGFGSYCLYHGNMEVEENENAALWLIKKVFHKLDIPLIIAGKNPSKKLTSMAAANANIQIISNPGQDGMKQIIANAHINVLPSLTDTGIKIKLIQALFEGRHCITNSNMISGSGVEKLCHVVDESSGFAERVEQLYLQSFETEAIEYRKSILENMFDYRANAKKMINKIWRQNCKNSGS